MLVHCMKNVSLNYFFFQEYMIKYVSYIVKVLTFYIIFDGDPPQHAHRRPVAVYYRGVLSWYNLLHFIESS